MFPGGQASLDAGPGELVVLSSLPVVMCPVFWGQVSRWRRCPSRISVGLRSLSSWWTQPRYPGMQQCLAELHSVAHSTIVRGLGPLDSPDIGLERYRGLRWSQSEPLPQAFPLFT